MIYTCTCYSHFNIQ